MSYVKLHLWLNSYLFNNCIQDQAVVRIKSLRANAVTNGENEEERMGRVVRETK